MASRCAQGLCGVTSYNAHACGCAHTRTVGVDAVCQICKDGGRDEFMLLCEACDVGFHYDCLTPPLKGAPLLAQRT